MSSGSVKVGDIGRPMYLTVNLLEGFDVERLTLHGYNSLYHFFMGFVGDPISYKNGCNWTGSKNSTIKGMFLEFHFYKLKGITTIPLLTILLKSIRYIRTRTKTSLSRYLLLVLTLCWD